MTSSRHRPSRRQRSAEWTVDTATRYGDAREQAHRMIARARIDELVHGERPDPTDRRTC